MEPSVNFLFTTAACRQQEEELEASQVLVIHCCRVITAGALILTQYVNEFQHKLIYRRGTTLLGIK